MEGGKLKVLMISSDRHIALPGSAVSARMKEYGKLLRELHIVLLCDKAHGVKEAKIADNVWVYPTNSWHKLFRPLDAVRIAKKLPANMVTTQDPFECGWVGLKLKRRKHIPLEAQLHTDSFSNYFSGFLNYWRKIIGKKVLREADGVRVVTKYMAERLTEEFQIPRARISVLPIYIDRKRLSTKKKLDFKKQYGWDKVLLSVARLTKEKHLSMAIRALALAREAYPNTGLVIVGAGKEEAKLRELTRSLGEGDHVVFAGWQDDPGPYYEAADIFIQTSKFEGYGMALIEAGLSGLPVVSTPVGIANELEPGIDLLVAPGRHSFANAIISLLRDEDKAKVLGANLKRTLEGELYTKEAYLKKLLENWEKLTTP